ncbi:PE domain-containing protein [Nocardia sp. BMG111209]|uniref:PE domain-containing protein n=1 Tax=Nocardia sp. BMG111209 TaxID=1160137 RepID=UPI00035DFEBC|nr:PE domain-containing protein [Nocardia sp. BMG111209]
MALEVIPEDFPALSATLSTIHTDLMGALEGTSVAANPTAAASDLVSQAAAKAFAVYHAHFYAQAAPGFTNILHGSQVLVPIAGDYTGSDESGGGYVTGAAAGIVSI